MLRDQNNMCVICGKNFSKNIRAVIDHCHSTGKTRSILCSPCNIGLGYIEKEEFFQKAMKYIAAHKNA